MLLVACSGGSSDGREIVIPRSAIDSLDNYAFTTDLDLSSAQGDLQADFTGVFQAPDRFQGTLHTAGMSLGRPAETELIIIGEDVWWREPGGEWQRGITFGDEGREAVDPFYLFAYWATPPFYVQGLDFSSLRLTTSGDAKTINGARALPVVFDRPALMAILDQGIFAEEAGKDPEIVREDTEAFLPEDIRIEAWLAEESLYPVRILITLSADEDEEFSVYFEKPLQIRLQLDITDPDAGINIVPPDVSARIAPTP